MLNSNKIHLWAGSPTAQTQLDTSLGKRWNSKVTESNSDKKLQYCCIGEKLIIKFILKYGTHQLYYSHS